MTNLNLITILSLLFYGGFSLYILTRWLPDARFFRRVSQSDIASRHVYGSVAALAASGGLFAAGLFVLWRPDALVDVALPVLWVGSFVLLLPVFWYGRQLASEPRIASGSERWSAAQALLATGLMGAVGVVVFLNAGAALPTRLPPPFEYASAVMPTLNPDGTKPAAGEFAAYCPGDPLMVEITGTTDGQARTTFVTGAIYPAENSAERAHVYDTIEASSVDRPELAGQELTFTFDGSTNGRFVPELEPGLYVYQHGSYEIGSLTASFTADFELLDCE